MEIKRNVPIPKAIRPPGKGRRKYPFDSMDVGDSFFLPGREKNTLSNHASTVGRKMGRKFSTRLCWMQETIDGWELCPDGMGTLGIGVWRTE